MPKCEYCGYEAKLEVNIIGHIFSLINLLDISSILTETFVANGPIQIN